MEEGSVKETTPRRGDLGAASRSRERVAGANQELACVRRPTLAHCHLSHERSEAVDSRQVERFDARAFREGP
eukprot:6190977-Pleurochrysis_carterae.AAC.2